MTAKQHAEWLSLLEISGPFLSLPVLTRVFPQGIDAFDAERARLLRDAYEEWADNVQGLAPDPLVKPGSVLCWRRRWAMTTRFCSAKPR